MKQAKTEMIEATLGRDVQRRRIAREIMARTEIEFKQAADEMQHIEHDIDNHLMDLSEEMGHAYYDEPPQGYESD